MAGRSEQELSLGKSWTLSGSQQALGAPHPPTSIAWKRPFEPSRLFLPNSPKSSLFDTTQPHPQAPLPSPILLRRLAKSQLTPAWRGFAPPPTQQHGFPWLSLAPWALPLSPEHPPGLAAQEGIFFPAFNPAQGRAMEEATESSVYAPEVQALRGPHCPLDMPAVLVAAQPLASRGAQALKAGPDSRRPEGKNEVARGGGDGAVRGEPPLPPGWSGAAQSTEAQNLPPRP